MPTHLFECLTHEELLLCFGICLATKAEETAGAYPIHKYATPGEEGPTNEWTELVKRAIRYLAFDHGFKFQGLRAHKDGRIGAERAICEANFLYVVKFLSGSPPEFDILLPRAMRFAERSVPSLDREPLRSLAADIEAEIALRANGYDKDSLAQVASERKRLIDETESIIFTPPQVH